MKKLQMMVLASLAVFAFGAILAATASAEITLVALWLVNGVAVAANLNVEIAGNLLLEDNKATGTPSVLCTGILDGFIGAEGKDEITKVLNLAKEEILGLGALALVAPTDCTTEKTCAASPIEVHPVGLPWKTQLWLMEDGKILDLIVGSGAPGTLFGYELLCVVVITVEDECTQNNADIEIINDPITGDAASAIVAQTPAADCAVGGVASGVNEPDELAFVTLVGSSELVTVSSE